ncbi:MAG: Plug and carboxypeptidase regulatory-like domain-containing protein [Acidobacteriota bacterium]|nr:Plug and carboxypeptidase regulatory-like domain-containing protein [Acidobacteriota bacterium]
MTQHSKVTLRLLSLAATLLLGLSGVALAQETTGRIAGQVVDPAGAVVGNAEVTLTNTSTREERKVQTDENGNYSFTQLQPATYDLSVRRQGFKEHINTGFELNVNDRKTFNIALETGSVNESVTITGEAPLIQMTPTVGDVVENRRVVELPLNNRNFMQLLTLVPGVTSSGSSEIGIGLTNVVDFSINGTRRNSINFLVDGVSNTDVGSNITLLSIPTVDSIQEFRVITSVPTAEFGRSGGGVVNLITRGGGRNFHGSFYEFLRNDRLNANSFFNNANGTFGASDASVRQGLATAGAPRSPRPKLRYNNFGYLISGPVSIPGLYNRDREKTFFLFSQEFRRIIRAPSLASAITVPSALERTGDFSEPGNLPIFDPLTGAQFPGNRIPSTRLNQAAVALLNLYPQPNTSSLTAGRGPNQFAVTTPNILNTRQETVRIDHNFSSTQRLTGRYTHDLSETREFGGLFFNATIPNVATTNTIVPGEVLAISLTSSFGPNIVNEAIFTFSGNKITTDLLGRYNGRDVTVPHQELFPENNSKLPPIINVTGQPTIGSGQLFNIRYKNFNPKDNFTIVSASHTYKFGGDISFESKDENAASATQGTYGFTGALTRIGSNAGIGLADFLLGRAAVYSEPQRDVLQNLRFGRTEFYAQDTWKIRPNFQLDYGVRYARYRQPYDKNNVLATFQPQLYNPARAAQCANVSCTLFTTSTFDFSNGFAYANQNSPYGRRVQKNDTNDWGPRLGFAWDPRKNGKTVLRGGYGIYYDQALVGIVEQNSFTTPPFNNSISLTGTFAAPIAFGNPAAVSAATTRGPLGTVNATTDPFYTPIIQQWSLTWQQEPFHNALFEIGYAGSAGNHLIRPVDINAATPQEIVAAARGVAGCDPALAASNNPANCINLARPYRGFAAITDRQTTATSRYHGLVSSFRLKPTNGLTAQIAYTWSKNITDATNDRDAVDVPQIRTNFHLERAVSRLDRTHVFVASYVYEMPTFHSGFAATTLGRHLLGGWEIAGIITAQKGLPLNRVVQGSTTVPARGSRPNIISDPSQNIPSNPAGGIPYAFNPLAFRPTNTGEIGNSGRAPLRFPSQFFSDVNFTKNLNFTERYRLQLRAEFYNIFNHAIFNDVFQTIPDLLPTSPAFNSIENLQQLSPAATNRFGQFFSTKDPRQVQLGLKFSF